MFADLEHLHGCNKFHSLRLVKSVEENVLFKAATYKEDLFACERL